MSTSALIMIIVSETVIIFFTAYFFWKAVKTPKKTEPDSYSEN